MVISQPFRMTLIHSAGCTIIYKCVPYNHIIFIFKRISCGTLLKYCSDLQIICLPGFLSALVQKWHEGGEGVLFLFPNKWVISFCHKNICGNRVWNASSHLITFNFASLRFSMTSQTPSCLFVGYFGILFIHWMVTSKGESDYLKTMSLAFKMLCVCMFLAVTTCAFLNFFSYF